MDGTLEAEPPQPAPAPVSEAARGAPISRIVAEVAARYPTERISLGEMAEGLGDRAFGMLVLLLLLPSLIPGMATVFGLPILVLGVQMGLGWRVPVLPRFLARQTIRREDLLKLAAGSSQWLRRAERYVRPRPGFFITPAGDRLFGWLTAYVALMLILPGPGTNGPPAFGNIIMALGLVEHDNKVTAIGVGVTILGCIFATCVVILVAWLGMAAFSMIF